MPDEPTDSAPEVGSAPGTGSVPGVTTAPVPEVKSRALYDPETGKLDVKKLAAWITGAIAVIGAISAAGAKVNGWAKWWLDIDDLEGRAVTCEERYQELNGIVRPSTPVRDANARLDEALPTISSELRESRKERQVHEQALLQLSTIHEFALNGAQEREAAREARHAVQWRRDNARASSTSAGVGNTAMVVRDPLESLEGM